MPGTADTAQGCEEFNNNSSQSWFAKMCEGKREYYQRLRAQNGIPEGYCAVCGQKPVREGLETCSIACTQESTDECCSFAIAMALPS